MPDVLSMGTFDTMHPGHLGLIERCRRESHDLFHLGRLVLAVNTDEFVRSYKGVEPIFTEVERVAMAEAVRGVDRVALNDGQDQPGLIARLLPRGGILVVGDDWAPPRDYGLQLGFGETQTFGGFRERHNIELRFVPRSGEWSTTEIRQRLAR